MIINDSD